MKDTEKAFNWIIDLLENMKIPYQISGGLAARIYGSRRDLADIDIDVPEKSLSILKNVVSDFIIFGPERYIDESFDIDLMTLNYESQEIDLAGFGTGKIFNTQTHHFYFLEPQRLSDQNLFTLFLKNDRFDCNPYRDLLHYTSHNLNAPSFPLRGLFRAQVQ